MNIKERMALLQKTKGKFFSCKFVKATTGEMREMTCRLDVSRYTKGGVNPNPRIGIDQVVVWENGGNEAGTGRYRTINVESLTEFRFGGKTTTF